MFSVVLLKVALLSFLVRKFRILLQKDLLNLSRAGMIVLNSELTSVNSIIKDKFMTANMVCVLEWVQCGGKCPLYVFHY